MQDIILSRLTGEEQLFTRRLEDMFRKSRGIPAFSSFLTQRQLLIAEAFVRQRQLEPYVLFHGGFSGAARQVLGIFPVHRPPDTALFPVEAVTLRYRSQDTLTHRDFLGSLMGLLITRESIGDIVPDTGRCTIFLLEPVLPVVLDELHRIGRIGVQCERGIQGEVTLHQEFDPIRGTVASERLDAVVSLLTGLSREKSAGLIRSDRVTINGESVSSVSREISESDTLSVRGYGKYVIDTIGNPTRKGRIPVHARKYR